MDTIIISTLKQSLMITAFVLLMMVVIDYINVQTRNTWAEKLRHSPVSQIIMAALLGITPGCMGAFTVVSLYTHRMVGLAALVSVMIATSGDEAFVMFALFPAKALLINAILFAIAIIGGLIVLHFTKKKQKTAREVHGFVVHQQDVCKCFDHKIILTQLRKISFERLAMIVFALLFIVLLLNGAIGTPAWGWKRVTFLIGSLFLLFVFISVPEHFLNEHLYKHIIKKHLLRILLWSWAAFLLLHFVLSNELMSGIIEKNDYLILLIAVVMGFIPESGPHLVFVTLFSQGMIPVSILIASSISQDGHGMLPLLAESRKDFFKVKAINMLIALLIGAALILAGL
ncbi:putative manganese transporter [Roseimarinus sediminis]|jgi:hypothetical protein|uniref:putative manganese transporter n=1 Tax=Roseimarinus sediminis TaxID=1610899 RepID=UPI003D241377